MALEELSDLCTPWCVHVVATLRIAEHMQRGLETSVELAAAARCNADALESVLRRLVEKGLFLEHTVGSFSLNEAAKPLLENSNLLGLNLDGLGGRFAHAWGTMLEYVGTGEPAYHRVFGVPFWEDLDRHPDLAAEFDALIGPQGHGTPNPDFEVSCGWDAIRTVIDVGGGTGAMLAQILRAHPHLRGTLVDLPRTVARSPDIFESAGVSDRAASVGQSFFDTLPTGADLYLLRGVINDWPDRESIAILRRCAEAASSTGRVMILKSVSPDHKPRSLSIEMMLVGGKQRTVTQFRELAEQSGLQVIGFGRQRSGEFATECEPVRGEVSGANS